MHVNELIGRNSQWSIRERISGLVKAMRRGGRGGGRRGGGDMDFCVDESQWAWVYKNIKK